MTEPAGNVPEDVVGEEAKADGINRFEAFFDAEQRRLYGTLCLVTGNTAEAEELMQEAFLQLWGHWDRVHTIDDPAAYLYRQRSCRDASTVEAPAPIAPAWFRQSSGVPCR